MEGELILHLVTALGAALGGAAIALKFRQPPIIGYLLVGVAIGPFTPGFVGESNAIEQLAEVGIVLLMFVVGVQLSLGELVRASRVAVIGGLVQVAVMIALGYAVGRALGWSPMASYAFGAVISNSSSTVFAKVLGDRGELDSGHGRLGLAWSSVQDISSVVLVAVLAMAGSQTGAAGPLLAKAAGFFLVVLPLSFWLLPRVLKRAWAARNREFFALAVVTTALAMAGGASLLGVSLALGAFLTGVVIGESDLAHRVLGDATPIRDVFSGVFFVSIGMLLDPGFVVGAWPLVLATVALIVVAKGLLIGVLARWLGTSLRVAVLMGAGLAQSAEFSFLMARIGHAEGALDERTFDLLLSATVVTILIAPWTSAAAPRLVRLLQERFGARLDRAGDAAEPLPAEVPLTGHAIVCGYGRVGRTVCDLLDRHGVPYLVVEEDLRTAETLRARGARVIAGDAGLPTVLERARLADARLLALCIPERMAVRRALELARAARIPVLARTHSLADLAVLRRLGAEDVLVGELELALAMGRRVLERFGVDPDAIDRAAADARRAAD